MLQLAKKVETIKGYINDIIKVIQSYNPNTNVTSTKKLKYVANEMAQVILDNSQVEVNYFRDVADSEFYIAFQIPVVTKTNVEFEVETNARASITVSGNGTTIYDNGLKGKRKLDLNVPSVSTNCEGWKPSNVVVRSNSNFTKFNIENQNNVIAIQGNMQGIGNLDCAFMGCRNLRVANLKGIESENIAYLFGGCNNLIQFVADFNPEVKFNAYSMFDNCQNLKYVNIDFSNIVNADSIFSSCYSLEKIDIPKDSTIPDKLDLSDTAIQTKQLIEFINNLKPIETKQTIYVNESILKSFSEVQLNSFKNKGYILDTPKYEEEL